MTRLNQRIEFIHLLRGIASLLVLWAHIPGWWLAERGLEWPPFTLTQQWIFNPLNLYQNAGYLGVVLFFLISGFIISHTAQREKRIEFLVKRIFRIWPGLLVAVVLMWFLQRMSGELGLASITGNIAGNRWDYVKAAFLINWAIPGAPYALSVTWTLYIEIVYYALMLALIPILRSHPIGSTVILLGMCVLLNGAHLIHPMLAWFPSTFVSLPIFVIGRVTFLQWSNQVSNRAAFALFVASSGILIWSIQASAPGFLLNAAATYVVALAMFIGGLLWSPSRLPQPFPFLADVSYPLYLVHMPAGVFSLNASIALGANLSLGIVTGLTVSLAVSWILNKTVDTVSKELARGIIQGSRPQ